MPGVRTWTKMLFAGGVLCIGGPTLVYYVMPTEEELFKRYNPELQRRSLQNRAEREEEFDNFVTRLKVAAKSDKHIWDAIDEIEAQKQQAAKDAAAKAQRSTTQELERRRQEIKRSTGG